jgi:acetylornithine/succinyldiaminopimelate/putrescine aminotransferase
VQSQALHRGLIVECGGRDDCVVRLLPPLNVSAEVVDTACAILVDVIGDLGAADAVPVPVGHGQDNGHAPASGR